MFPLRSDQMSQRSEVNLSIYLDVNLRAQPSDVIAAELAMNSAAGTNSESLPLTNVKASAPVFVKVIVDSSFFFVCFQTLSFIVEIQWNFENAI